MGLAEDKAALRVALETKRRLGAAIPPCQGCGARAPVAMAGGRRLECGECGQPVEMPPADPHRESPSGAGVSGEGGDQDRTPAAEVGPGEGARLREDGGLTDVEIANPMRTETGDPAVSGGPGHSGIVTAAVSRETPLALPAGPSAAVEVGVMRGKVRRGTVEFYEDAKSAHRRGMRSILRYMREKEKEEAAGGSSAMLDPHYRWCIQEAGKFAHSQAPREVKAETRLLIEFDMGG